MTALASSTTPLIALDAVVIDTETTGLDPAQARMVEIAALGLSAGRIDEGRALRRLVRPGIPIPGAATAIHGIGDDAVASAPSFAEVWPEFSAFTGDAVVIGHTLGFDLAVLERECRRAGLPWRRPRTLDTRLLAQIAAPNLAGFSLEHLAGWLGVALAGRHSAAGDARVTAAIFVALLPKLRERGIRTLAEAEQACRSLTAVLDDHARAGWAEPVAPPREPASERLTERIDTYPFRHRVCDVMSAPVRWVPENAPVAEALARVARERISSLIVVPDGQGDGAPAVDACGIVTERDLLRTIAQAGAGALQQRVGSLASRPLLAIPADAFVYRAIGRMSAANVRHLAVRDGDGRVCGMLSARDLLRLRAHGAVALGDEIDRGADVPALARAWATLPQVAASLRAEGLSGREIAAVISRELAALTRAAARLAERRQADHGRGPPPCAYAVVVLGSAGRGESLLAMDQDNALVFEQGEPGGEADRWFAQLGEALCGILHEVGVPYCPGGVMAMDEAWRGSVATWRGRVADWIRRSSPRDLMSVDIFFDLRGVHGAGALSAALLREAYAAAHGQAAFAKLLAEAAGTTEPGLALFGRIRTENGRIDLKKAGLFGIVTFARALAIRHHVMEQSTPARLAALIARQAGAAQDLQQLVEAQAVFLDLVLDQQIHDLQQGQPPTNKVLVKRLTTPERGRLRDALEQVRHLNDLTRDLLFSG
jgi:DNA polymerase-3 subunit epsilon/CBS domain-containing protein